ncbi:MAG: hypothetical protein FWJ34_15380 [Geminocystis sp. GBBB08]|nr:hypothetical protein [Geminocystis sp. GBBB08]
MDSKFELLDKKIDSLQSDLNTVTIDVEKLKTQNEQIVKRLDTVDARLNTITLGVFGLVGVLVTGLLTIISKIVFFSNP